MRDEIRPLPPIAPILKWPGGKRKLIKHLTDHVPSGYGRYFEPFAGGAALFFALRPATGILSDTNTELINCYTQVRDRPDELIDCLSQMRNSQDDYYRVRQSQPRDSVARAARIIYLSNLSFNGIHRVNLQGQFNVPYGRKTDRVPYNADLLLQASTLLHNIDLVVADFEDATSSATQGDLVYFDPPYTVLHSNNGFVKYNEKIFSWDDQTRLAALACRLSKMGCHVMVSNASHASVRDLYPDFDEKVIQRASQIAAQGKYRRPVTESLFLARRPK